MILYLIRHAQSRNNFLGTQLEYDKLMEERDADPPITDLGWEQARRLGDYLAHREQNDSGEEGWYSERGYGISHIYCSPMLRTLQTAQPIAKALGLQPEVWTEIFEHGALYSGHHTLEGGIQGDPGLSRVQMEETFAGYTIPNTVTEAGWWKSSREEEEAYALRVERVAGAIRSWWRKEQSPTGVPLDASHERIAFVSHGMFISSLIKALLGHAPDSHVFYRHYNTGVTRLDFHEMRGDEEWVTMRFMNRTRHLEPDLFSG